MITTDDLNWWLALAPTLSWRFAKTMPDTPHSYVVRGKQLGDADFERAVRVIRTYGKPAKFYSRTNIYLTHNDLKWWTMGAPVAEETVINTAAASQVYGVQDAPITSVIDLPENKAHALEEEVYNSIATDYDTLYLSEEDLSENALVRSLIREHFSAYAPTTLDVGCGTGLLLDLGPVSSKLYTGIDPSSGMLNELLRKYPNLKKEQVLAGTLEERLPDLEGRKYDLTCSLFGAASYMEPREWAAMLEMSQDMTIFMTLREGYLPKYWTGAARELMLPKVERARVAIEALAKQWGAERIQLANEDITVIHR